MSFSTPSPPQFITPAPPPPVAPLTPATMKPPRKAPQPTFLGDLASTQQQRTLIGGAPTTFGA